MHIASIAAGFGVSADALQCAVGAVYGPMFKDRQWLPENVADEIIVGLAEPGRKYPREFYERVLLAHIHISGGDDSVVGDRLAERLLNVSRDRLTELGVEWRTSRYLGYKTTIKQLRTAYRKLQAEANVERRAREDIESLRETSEYRDARAEGGSLIGEARASIPPRIRAALTKTTARLDTQKAFD